ncbi:MAG: SRPBCC domain-containing protein [Solirubrobacterales bacterium]|nr:SRPBCC domain-containing protein [Solirubrobacterales bacterium]
MAIEDVAVRREVILPVDRKTAWAALEDPQELATWLADEVEIEIEVGAQGWLRWEDGEQRHAKVEEVEPGRRIVLRWSESDGPETLVEMVLDDVSEGTRLVVLELPVARLEAVATLLDQGPRFSGGAELRTRQGPQMVAALA